ncbi:uncharacterized protein LOC108044336 isoform X1 [Drosophila rhopaloa]|uniref:Uncharacterized protein n=1 Tax=Drosophila rhopaloa TaxID=1041015 RepID=A0ABM5J6T3_DRORH|nr:uncharacterized protein LOC108044336 isoform X1 [Drosophila rhopaloa]
MGHETREPCPVNRRQLNGNGILVLNPTNNLQNANEKAIAQYRENLKNAVREILADLPNTRKKKRRQALQEALAALTGLTLAVTPLEESLGKIKKQQAELIWKFKLQHEWKFWAAAKVQKVGESTDGLRTAEAVSITENLNNRYGLQFRDCVGEFLWDQIRFNLDLKTTLSSLQSSTSELIDATERCPTIKAKKCRKAVRNAVKELQNAPQDLHDLWIKSDTLKDTQKESYFCLEITLDDYADERVEVERHLEDIIEEYRESITTPK